MLRIIFVFSIFFLFASNSFGQKEEKLYPIYKAPNYQNLAFFNEKGKEVFEFSDKTARVLDHINPFQEGKCFLEGGDNTTYIIDNKGNILFTLKKCKAISKGFHKNQAVFFDQEKREYITMKLNQSRLEIIQRFEDNSYYVPTFDMGVSVMYKISLGSSLYSDKATIIDDTFEPINDEVYKESKYAPQGFVNGFVLLDTDSGKGFLDKTGKIRVKIDTNEYSLKGFNKYGYALIQKIENGYFVSSRIIDTTGKTISLPEKYKKEIIGSLSDGLIMVNNQSTKKIGFIDLKGNLAIPYQFTEGIGEWENGYTLVIGVHKIGKKVINEYQPMVIDKKGKVKKYAKSLYQEFSWGGVSENLVYLENTCYDKKSFKAILYPNACSSEFVKSIKQMRECPAQEILYIDLNNYDETNDKHLTLKDIPNLNKLNPRVLKLRGFRIEEFPKEILQMANLEELDLSDNLLKEIPVEIEQLKKLKTLDLSGNQLKKLPYSIANLPHLQELDLTSNEIEEEPKHPSARIKLKDNSKMFMVYEQITFGDGTTMTGEEFREKEEREREEEMKEYELPELIPTLSDKGAQLVLEVLQNPPKHNLKKLQREFKEAQELMNQSTHEGQGLRRNSQTEVYKISKSRKRKILKEVAKIPVENPQNLPKPLIEFTQLSNYYYQKANAYLPIVLEQSFTKDFNNVKYIQENFPKEALIKGFKITEEVERQLAEKKNENEIKTYIRQSLEQEFGKMIARNL